MTKKENIQKDMINIARKMKKLQAQYQILKIQLENLEEKTETGSFDPTTDDNLKSLNIFGSRN